MGAVTAISAARGQRIDPLESDIEKLLREARLKLIETGTRNRLINTSRGAKRTRCLPIVGARPDSVFVNLFREGRQLRLHAHGGEESAVETAGEKIARLVAKEPGQTVGGRSHASRSGLRTQLAPELLQKRLHAIYRDAKTAEEERGVNILFLALGFLRWYEDDRSDVVRQAPLILLPINLVRDGKRSTFDLAFRDDDIASNQALQERLRGDFGINLPDVPETDSWLPSTYFSAVAASIASKRRWSIDTDGVELGFYSWSKFLIMRDLEPANWPGNSLVQHPLVRGLLLEGLADESTLPPDDANLDALLQPADLVHVVDADSSQTCVIDCVRAGRNLIVHGPPGTGKSQTITNMIAAALHAGKSVLFVAEKMAALNVVHDRLRKAGLEELCLELHSNTANKRLVADRLDRTLQSTADFHVEDDEAAGGLTIVRDALNHVAARLHTQIGSTGMTPYQVLSIQIAAMSRQITPEIGLVEAAAGWTRDDFAEMTQRVERLSDLSTRTGPLHRHVFYGVGRMALQPADFQRLTPQLQDLAEDAAALAARTTQSRDISACNEDRPLPVSGPSSCCCGRPRTSRATRSPSPPPSPRRHRRGESSTLPKRASNGAARGRVTPNLSMRRFGGRRSRAYARPSPKAPPSGRRRLAAPIAKPTASCAASRRGLCQRAERTPRAGRRTADRAGPCFVARGRVRVFSPPFSATSGAARRPISCSCARSRG